MANGRAFSGETQSALVSPLATTRGQGGTGEVKINNDVQAGHPAHRDGGLLEPAAGWGVGCGLCGVSLAQGVEPALGAAAARVPAIGEPGRGSGAVWLCSSPARQSPY